MQISVNSSTPLAALGLFTSQWLASNPDYPIVTIEASSDQAGTVTLQESELIDSGVNTVAYAAVVAAGPASLVQGIVRAAFYRVVYQNGATAQATFVLAMQSSNVAISPSQSRQNDLILRELRAQSLLLASLKEPTGTQPNIPYGLDAVTNQ